ncbi:LysR family transcriptional regulator [Maritimibacter dapengensis]|uniref:LysR family transcriptional regulator n=1 Tax=Maritimibacter dapengensis TaxID=2836868 RepID=A0ABS6T3G8_9RHOB|nr:LysR family transcriptional regulator [Maritimibacter dapengensis]MBV7379515.1 LysR family transcriptional regulator [Maritimibacter dapengensis]
MKQMDWDDLRFVLAVADAGSLSGAARRLGVNHATVLRRIDGFENRAGLPIFDRTPRGYRVASQRRRVIEKMREVETAVLGVERAMTAASAPLAGVVRVTSTDSLCIGVLPAIIGALESEAEGLVIDLSSQNLHVDLARLDADIAVRPALERPEGLIGEEAARMGFAVYQAAGSNTATWLGFTNGLAKIWLARAFDDMAGDDPMVAGSDSFLVLREMAATGRGRAILPCVLGDPDPRLSRVEGLTDIPSTPLWVVSHPDLADVPRIRTVRAMLGAALAAHTDRLAGVPNA